MQLLQSVPVVFKIPQKTQPNSQCSTEYIFFLSLSLFLKRNNNHIHILPVSIRGWQATKASHIDNYIKLYLLFHNLPVILDSPLNQST